ncbi:MAG: MraZ N-terminal domain-containing protein, partial [Planctomycetota bacterium]|nr:MraZ N-terminal domain-containing protein [Planctomycetota bacterium]
MSSPQFLGVHSATIDPEGRIQLPVQLRDEVNLRSPEFRFMASLEADGSICLRSREGFDRWTERL